VTGDPDLVHLRLAEDGTWVVTHPGGDVHRFPSRDEAFVAAQELAKADGLKVLVDVRRAGPADC
jgi:hypothetical protein